MREIEEADAAIIHETIKRGTSAREIGRAYALRMRDKGLSVIEIADYLEITPRTVIAYATPMERFNRGLQPPPHPNHRIRGYG